MKSKPLCGQQCYYVFFFFLIYLQVLGFSLTNFNDNTLHEERHKKYYRKLKEDPDRMRTHSERKAREYRKRKEEMNEEEWGEFKRRRRDTQSKYRERKRKEAQENKQQSYPPLKLKFVKGADDVYSVNYNAFLKKENKRLYDKERYRQRKATEHYKTRESKNRKRRENYAKKKQAKSSSKPCNLPSTSATPSYLSNCVPPSFLSSSLPDKENIGPDGDSLAPPPYKTKPALRKAAERALRAFPKSPRKMKAVLKYLCRRQGVQQEADHTAVNEIIGQGYVTGFFFFFFFEW